MHTLLRVRSVAWPHMQTKVCRTRVSARVYCLHAHTFSSATS
jgi:hypothetical protein